MFFGERLYCIHLLGGVIRYPREAPVLLVELCVFLAQARRVVILGRRFSSGSGGGRGPRALQQQRLQGLHSTIDPGELRRHVALGCVKVRRRLQPPR